MTEQQFKNLSSEQIQMFFPPDYDKIDFLQKFILFKNVNNQKLQSTNTVLPN